MNEIKKNDNLHIEGFFDEQTSTISYVVHDNIEKKCAVIDSVLDFDYSSGDIDYVNADKIISYIARNKLNLEWLIETHVHADHLSASPYIQKKLGGKIGISEKIHHNSITKNVKKIVTDNIFKGKSYIRSLW